MNSWIDNAKRWESLEDGDLVQLAQSGEREAFGELVRRHRSKVYGYARTITQESFLAEDIVQEALIRAFMHLGKLVDVERFLPWVHRIIRNHAFTKLKSNSATQEKTFSQLESALPKNATDAEEWNDLDCILRRLNRSVEDWSARGDVPEEGLMRKETLKVLSEVIGCLKPRERLIFESHFFDQLSPQEIARLFQLSSTNVYQIISRSRKKVVQERIRVTVDSYVKTRKDMGQMKKVILNCNGMLGEVRTWTSVVDALYTMLKYTERKLSYPMVMGYTGHAFRINTVPESVHIAGPTAYNFADVMVRGLRNIGFQAKVVDGMSPSIGPNANLIDPARLRKETMEKREFHHALPEALDLIHRSLDRGYPVLAWDIFFPEFGLIYGYDDERRQLYTDECGRRDTLPYENLGRSVLEEIFVLAIDESFEVNQRDRLHNALLMILDHYDGKENEIPSDSVKGIRAYEVWCDAFRGGSVEPNGNAYNIAVIMDGRKYAAEFLKEVQTIWPDIEEAKIGIRMLLGEAADIYAEISKYFTTLHEMFPFPEGGEPNTLIKSHQTIELLQMIKVLEIKGAKILRNIVDLLQ